MRKPDAFASTLYADDILLFKPISSPEDHKNLQKDIDAISKCTSAWHLTLNSSKCKYLIAPRKRQPHLPPGGLLLGDCILEQVQSYPVKLNPKSLSTSFTDCANAITVRDRGGPTGSKGHK